MLAAQDPRADFLSGLPAKQLSYEALRAALRLLAFRKLLNMENEK